VMDVTPDAVPAIDAVPGRPGLFIAAGFSGHGLGTGPASGELLADLITNRTPSEAIRLQPLAMTVGIEDQPWKLPVRLGPEQL